MARDLHDLAQDYADGTDPDALAASVRARLAWRIRRGFRVCTACRKRLPVRDFGLDASRRDGLSVVCRACRKNA